MIQSAVGILWKRYPNFTRKARKFIRTPGLFVKDYIGKRRSSDIGSGARVSGSAYGNRLYSVVSAVYNVEDYLDDFFKSLVNQTLDFRRHIELIMVDDGSSDASMDIIRRWQRKFPKNIRYIRKENGGQASARNVGLSYASGAWITFIDPDDFVDASYFYEVEKALNGSKVAPAMVSCNFIFYFENQKKFSDTHPLKYRFAKESAVIDFSKPTKHLQLSAATAFFDAAVIHGTAGLLLDERIKPNFEDAHFVNCYLAACNAKNVIFLKSAKYYYRKRAAGTSTLDGAWLKSGLYDEVLNFGVLDMLRRHAPDGRAPEYVQRVALYHLIWYFKKILAAPNTISFLGEVGKSRFWDLLNEIFQFIDKKTILEFELGGAWFLHKAGMLNCFKESAPGFQNVYIEDLDLTQSMLQLRYFTAKVGFESFVVNGNEVFPVAATVREHVFAGKLFVQERIIWIPVARAGKMQVALDGANVHMMLGGKKQASVDLSQLFTYFVQKKVSVAKKLPLAARALRYLACTRYVRRKYEGAWILMDRDICADDNAEHLYRYLMTDQPNVKSYFVLRRNSADWRRLSEEGFKLIPFGGVRHRLALLNCSHYASSHADAYVTNFMQPRYYGDVLSYRFTFLQHGITKDDLSDWLNSKQIDCLITAAPREAASISGVSRYKFSNREVVMTGFPRHDGLFKRRNCGEKVILVMPTWRKNLAGPPLGRGNARALNPDFIHSEFYKQWSELLSGPHLERLAKEFGYRVVLQLHPNVAPYLHLFNLPEHVSVFRHDGRESMQELFGKSRILVTDYSSVAFEFAWLNKAVLYFQFDREYVFGGGHTYEPGYYSYFDDGFGPVCETQSSLVDELTSILRNQGQMGSVYVKRAAGFFGYRDGDSCKRVFAAINSIDRMGKQRFANVANLLSQAQAAFDTQRLTFAEARWHSLIGLTPDATLKLAQVKRALGKFDEALELLADGSDNILPEWQIERAELLEGLNRWYAAAILWQDISVSSLCAAEYEKNAICRSIAAYLRAGYLEAIPRLLDRMSEPVVDVLCVDEARGCIAAERGAWDIAAEHFAKISEDQTMQMSPRGRILAAWTSLRTCRSTLVFKLITNLNGSSAELAEANYVAGLAAIDLQDDKRLLTYWTALIKGNYENNSGDPVSWLTARDYSLLAAAYRRAGKVDSAIEMIEKVTSDHLTPAVLMEKIECSVAGKRWQEVVHYSSNILGHSMTSDLQSKVWDLRGKAFEELGDIESAKQSYKRALDFEVDGVSIHVSLMRLAYRQADYDTAIAHGLFVYQAHRQVPVSHSASALPPSLLSIVVHSLQACGRINEAAALLYKEAAHVKVQEVLGGTALKADSLFQCAQWIMHAHSATSIVSKDESLLTAVDKNASQALVMTH